MNGRIKWFSAAKGYGFITETNGALHYFNAFDFKGEERWLLGDSLPSNQSTTWTIGFSGSPYVRPR